MLVHVHNVQRHSYKHVRNLDACLEEVSVKSLEMIHTTFEQVNVQAYVMLRYSMVIIPADGVGLTGAILLGVPEC